MELARPMRLCTSGVDELPDTTSDQLEESGPSRHAFQGHSRSSKLTRIDRISMTDPQ